MRVLITGMAGFIGSHLLEHILKTTDWHVVGLDRLDETSTLARLDTDAYRAHRARVRFVWHDLRAPINPVVANQLQGWDLDAVIHLAASTHVDRSIEDPITFVHDNVLGTAHLLEFARRHLTKGARLLYFSTDEVFGPAAPGVAFTEWDRYRASNPYAATKAAGEELAYAYHNTYGLATLVTHCMNAFGERQHREKFLPLILRKLTRGEPIDVHSDPRTGKPTSRGYVHARNVCAAVLYVLQHGVAGEKYNLPGQQEIDSQTMVELVADYAGLSPTTRLVDAVTHRPGHDVRYMLDADRLFNMGFTYPKPLLPALEKTVAWYLANPDWLA